MKLLEIAKSIINEKLTLGRNERVHLSREPIASLLDKEQGKNFHSKPRGLWYGFGDAWIKYAKSEDRPENWSKSFKYQKHAYKIYPNLSKIIVIEDMWDAKQFYEKYHFKTENKEEIERNNEIDWVKVSQDYSGIEIPTYDELGMGNWCLDESLSYCWLETWDVPSGCIWRSDGIARIKEL